MVSVKKIENFPSFSFSIGILGQGNVFDDILERKKAFYTITRRSSKT